MTTATPEQINGALARWLGWQTDPRYFPKWHDGKEYTKYSTLINSPDYFDPYHRIDHAWLLVEHMNTVHEDEKIKFMLWWLRIHFWALPASEAARAICEAIVEICEVAV